MSIAQNAQQIKSAPVQPKRRAISLDIWGRRLLIGIVIAYAAILVLAPLAGLVFGAFAEGIGAIFTALNQPDVFGAFQLTIDIGLITIAFHALFGTILALSLIHI